VIHSARGSLIFDVQPSKRLRFFNATDPIGRQVFRDIVVTEPTHPYVARWWPRGPLVAYEHTFVHTTADFVEAVAAKKSVRPNFSDGLRNQRVMDAIMRSTRRRCWIKL